MINQNLQADNQNGQQEPQAVNQGARTDNGSARAEGAAMTETPAAEQALQTAGIGPDMKLLRLFSCHACLSERCC